MRAIRKIGWGYDHGVAVGIAHQKAGQGIRKWIAGVDVVKPGLRWDEDGRIHGAAAEVVLAVGAHAEVAGVAVQAGFYAPLPGVLGVRPGEVLLALEEVAVLLHD